MTTAAVVRPGVPVLGRTAAVLAVASALVHLIHVTPDSLASLAMVAMAAACLPCAWHLWQAPTASVWRLTALLDLTMLLIHLTLMSDATSHAGPHGGASSVGMSWFGAALVVGQLALAASSLRRRGAGVLRRW